MVDPNPMVATSAPTDPDAVVQASGLTRRFDDLVAVSAIDLDVAPGTILGVVGPSGSGKTTTIRMLTGSLAPTSGRVRVFGEIPSAFRRATRERIGYLPQRFILYPDLTVRENIDFVASLFGLLLFRRRRRRRAVMELLGLMPLAGRRARALSGGEQRRLSLACALVHQPALLILDEPTAGVDPILRRTIWDEIHRLREAGVTSIVTTQYVTEAEECDDVAVIAGGRLAARASPANLRRQAFGGEVVEVETAGTFDASVLASDPGTRDLRQTGLRTFRAIVDDAGTATPAMVESVAAAHGEVTSVRVLNPSFEEVFAALVEDGHDLLEPDGVAPGQGDPEPEDDGDGVR